MQYGFHCFFLIQDPLQRPFSFSAFSFLSYSVCLLTIIVPSPNGSAPGQKPILVELLLGLHLAPGSEHCETSSFSHGYKTDQSSHDPRDPVNSFRAHISSQPYYQITLPYSLLLLLMRSVLAPPTTFSREPVFLQVKNSSNESKIYSFLHEETAEACLPFLSSTKTSCCFSFAVIKTC